MHELISIRMSHYNEKARWALEHYQVPYKERGYMPLLHMFPVAMATRKNADASSDGVSSRYSTPVLITDDGQRICDSRRILRYLSDRFSSAGDDLYPSEAVSEIEERAHDVLGAHCRRIAYFYGLQDLAAVRQLGRDNVGAGQALVFSALAPVGRMVLRRALNINAESSKASLNKVRAEFDHFDKLVDDRQYVVADRLTAADIALACMVVPVLLVSRAEGYGATLPTMDNAHPDLAALAAEFRARPTGRYALRLFAADRN